MTAPGGGTSARRGLVAAMLVVLNLGLVALNLDKHDALPFSTGLWSNDGDETDADLAGDEAVQDAEAEGDAAAVTSTEPTTDNAAETTPVTDEGTNNRAEALQAELNRVTAATPIIFESGGTAVTDLHARILNSVASTILAYPDLAVTVVGFTDDAGTPEANEEVSRARAQAVQNYLVSQGVPEANLTIRASGEATSTGSAGLARLERRVEFSVQAAGVAAPAEGANPIRIAIVAPSARNDVAFTQSMVDAVEIIAAERAGVEVSITDNTFVPAEAAAAITDYAAQGYDLVLAHGSQFGPLLVDIAPEYPEVAFAWGTASDTFGLPNVYAYDAASQQGGYVMGALAVQLSESGVLGVVGPIELGDAKLYVDGFAAGAQAENAGTDVRVTYTDSFSDVALAADAAREHVGAGADVMTGSSQMVVGAVSVASEGDTLWFGTQANQTVLAPSLVVASQVYHWEVILREILTELDSGILNGRTYTADLANGGLIVEYNDQYAVPDAVRQRGDQLIAGIVDGSVVVPGG